jgi:V8-like Glu-specific endopeptidase
MFTEASSAQRATTPYSLIGLMQVSWPSGEQTIGTFSVVGRNDLLTAGHMVYNPDYGGYATDFEFYLAADYNFQTNRFDDQGNVLRFQKFELFAFASQLYQDRDNSTVTDAESQYDVALIGLDTAVGDQYGWLTLSKGYDSAQTALAIGYPSASYSTGMMLDSVPVSALTSAEIYTSSRASLSEGSSGGPLLAYSGGSTPSKNIIGVMSSTDGSSNSWADLDLTYSDILSAMASNNGLINASTGSDTGVIAEIIATNATAGLALYKSISGRYVIDIDAQAAGDAFSGNHVSVIKGKSKSWVPKTNYSIEDIRQNDSGDYLIGLERERPGKASIYATQLVDDATGRVVGGLTKVTSPSWAESHYVLQHDIALVGSQTLTETTFHAL